MNFLTQYYTEPRPHQFSVSAIQGSNFAKQIAGDFNPIHHSDSNRFVVPGDLLFAIALNQYGLHTSMAFQFLELVKADTSLNYPEASFEKDIAPLEIVNDKGKPLLRLALSGESSQKASQTEQLLRNYVAFSGQNFPHILVPLMKQHNVMINPKRPLVIYESMSLEFTQLDFDELNIELAQTTLDVDGKRGYAKLHFSLNSGAAVIGSGIKNLVLSGLREYQEQAINDMCEEYLASKTAEARGLCLD